jgi:hypothetical protein
MTLRNTIRSLLGVPYSHPEIIQPSTSAPSLRPVVEKVDTALQGEEQKIVEIQRNSYQSFSPVLSPTDPAVQAVTFRNRFEPSAPSEADRRARVLRAQQSDAPVEPRRELLIAAPEPATSQAERFRRHLRAEESIVPVMRKQA